MALEEGSVDYIDDLVITDPLNSEDPTDGAGHIRAIKKAVQQSFPNVDAACNPTPTEFNRIVGITAAGAALIDDASATAQKQTLGTALAGYFYSEVSDDLEVTDNGKFVVGAGVGAITFTLPPASDAFSAEVSYIIYNWSETGTLNIAVDDVGTEYIKESGTTSLAILPRESVIVKSASGTAWLVHGEDKTTGVTAGTVAASKALVVGASKELATAAAGEVVLTLKAAGSQTASIQTWTDSSDNVLTEVKSNGRVAISQESRSAAAVTSGGSLITNPKADTTGIKVILDTSQTADALSIVDSGGSTRVMYVNASGNVYGTGAYNTISDERTKEDITDAEPVDIMGLRPRRFKRKGQDRYEYGFIAQELAEVIPEAVVVWDEETGYLGIQPDQILAQLVLEVQNLHRELDALK